MKIDEVNELDYRGIELDAFAILKEHCRETGKDISQEVTDKAIEVILQNGIEYMQRMAGESIERAETILAGGNGFDYMDDESIMALLRMELANEELWTVEELFFRVYSIIRYRALESKRSQSGKSEKIALDTEKEKEKFNACLKQLISSLGENN